MSTNPFGVCLQENCEEDSQPELPSSTDMAKNLLSSGKDILSGVLSGDGLMVEESVQKNRLDICSTCEFFIKESVRCTKCGCFMNTKTMFKKVSCPVGKW